MEKIGEDILKKLSKPLDIKEVEFRVQSISSKGWATLLAYKDARTDMNRLDEVCGTNWQNKYEVIDGQLFCSIGIKIKDEWIWRSDVGTESQTEKEKGRASDSFKRAGFRFGIGRELYDYPRIFLQLKSEDYTGDKNKAEFKTKVIGSGQNQKTIGASHYGLDLKKWTWDLSFDDKGKVMKLVGKDASGMIRYDSDKDFNSLPKKTQVTQNPVKAEPKKQEVKKESKEKPKLKTSLYQQALNSKNLDSLTKSLKQYDLTPDQTIGISKRIAEVKEQKKINDEK